MANPVSYGMIRDEVIKIVENALRELQKDNKIKNLREVNLEHPAKESFGDYSTNIALVIGRKDLAEDIAEKVRSQNKKIIERVDAVDGFINFFISKERLSEELESIIKGKYGSSSTKTGFFGRKKKILIEYSSPNISKSFGVGHLRSTIIGQAIYNIYNFLGWESLGINHLGDWGTPHGKIIYQIKRKNLNVKDLSVKDLENLYVDFHKEAKENPEFEDGAREWFLKLEKGDKEALSIWEHTRKVSLKEFDRIYDLLDVHIDKVFGESFYEGMLDDIVKESRDKGIAKKSEGALMVEFKVLPPAMLLKSDGATTYFTRDLAALKYRLDKFKPDVILYETGAEQELHFKQVFESARLLGWIKNETLVHVAHGFYRWEHGKFETRSGKTVHLDEILNEAVERAKKIIEDTETMRDLSDEEKGRVAKAVGIGGVKYNDLSHNPRGDIIFEWDKILNLKGNSAPYIQYTYARCRSILKKADLPGTVSDLPGTVPGKLSEEEISILRYIYRFPEVVRESSDSFSPNFLCSFVFELSQRFNLFYAEQSVLSAGNKEAKKFRLLLTAAVAEIIHSTFSLLGIETPEKL